MAAPNASVKPPPKFVPPKDYSRLAVPSPGGKWVELEAFMAPFLQGFAVVDEATREALFQVTGVEGLMNPKFLEVFFGETIRGDVARDVAVFENVVSLGINLSSASILERLCSNKNVFTLLPAMVKIRVDMDVPVTQTAVDGGFKSKTFRQLLMDKSPQVRLIILKYNI